MTDPTVVQQPQGAPAEPPRKSLSEIASEMFGNEFKGEAKKRAEPPKEPEPKPDDTQDGEVPIEEPTEGEQETAEPEEGKAPAPADTGETPIATVSELVEHLEADPEWFKSLKVPVTVDGTPTEATIKDLVDSYQIKGAAEHRLETAKQFAQKESEAWAAKQQQLESQINVAAELIKSAEATLDRDVKAIDPQLRDTDPAEWAARVAEFNQRRGFIEKMKQDTVANYQANAQARAQEFEVQKQQYLQQQSGVLLEKLPEWRDPKCAEAEKAKLTNYLFHQGFAQQELANLIDHRQVLLARKAMLYDESRGQVDTAKKKVAKVPKVMKPGAPKPMEQRATERLQALKAKLEKSGSLDDALAYRMAKLGVRR
jgi:hypothetical protein